MITIILIIAMLISAPSASLPSLSVPTEWGQRKFKLHWHYRLHFIDEGSSIDRKLAWTKEFKTGARNWARFFHVLKSSALSKERVGWYGAKGIWESIWMRTTVNTVKLYVPVNLRYGIITQSVGFQRKNVFLITWILRFSFLFPAYRLIME